MKSEAVRILGIFAHLDTFTRAIGELRRLGYGDLSALSPVPRHEIEEAIEGKKSPVRLFTLLGGISGGLTALILTIATSTHYPLITGGKPIVSVPPFLVIVFELTILFGALATILGMLINIRLPRIRLEPGYEPRFSEDRFGLWVRCSADQAQRVQELLRVAGAEEVRREGD
ncbi:MAG: DUF3341 domain-containing protein [Deltaproteobacteria bacterium]|nr:DUF3341 domain-containing protein [Deltaproteobacteria bacterium]